MKTLKVLLQEVVSGIKAWVNSNFAQESNTVHKTGNETVNGEKTFTGNVFHQNSRSIYRNTNISRETLPKAYTAVDTYSHLGADWSYWGGLKHIWKTDGTSITELAISNHKQVNGTWNQGFWSLQLSALKDFSNIEFIPSNDAMINLGSSSKQWKSVYAQNYYYNGTAWGLDKNNVWSGSNKFTDLAVSSVNTIDITQSTLSSATISANLPFKDNNGRYWGAIRTQVQTDRGNILKFTVSNWKTNGTQGTSDLCFYYDANLDKKSFYPTGSNVDLGNSSFKWKTLNGVNPGELSLPEGGNATSITVDITDWYVQDPDYPNDPNEKILDGTEHEVETSVPGWLHVQFENVAGNFAYARQYNAGKNMADEKIANGLATDNFSRISFVYPIHTKLKVSIKSKSAKVRIFPCLGNV